jgi:hypothetical protein
VLFLLSCFGLFWAMHFQIKSPLKSAAKSNKRLERTRHERAALLSCVGEPLKRSVGFLPLVQSKNYP